MEHTHAPAGRAAEKSHHPPASVYINVFKWLFAFTIIELLVSFLPSAMDSVKVPLLVLFAVLKASLVAMFYMHLRYDRLLYTVILLIGVFFAVLIGSFLPFIQR
ncbi:MAG: cytochrome C oxidase subunit IV family protein [Anaerolineales bacterium]|nr:cytochrome C oxidase subunit IV family protein [Anaerolineales bacterium]